MAGIQNNSSDRMKKWALEHPEEWRIVLGLRQADAEQNLKIQKMLKADGFFELSEMMAIKVYELLAADGDGN